MLVFAVATQKGGVGKTTTTVSLAAVWARDHKVLVVDADAQASATTWLGVRDSGERLLDVYRGDSTIAGALQSTVIEGVDLVASGPAVHGVDKAMAAEPGPCELNLKYALEDHAETAKHDIVVIDCPPSLGFATVAALAAAPEVIVPVGTRPMDSAGLGQLRQTIESVTRKMRCPTRVVATIPTFYDARTLASAQMLARLQNAEPETLTIRVDLSTRLAEAPAHTRSIIAYAPKSRSAHQYNIISEEILSRVQETS